MSKAIRMAKGPDALFLKACELANVKPTHRQYLKWKRGEGSAYEKRNEAKSESAG